MAKKKVKQSKAKVANKTAKKAVKPKLPASKKAKVASAPAKKKKSSAALSTKKVKPTKPVAVAHDFGAEDMHGENVYGIIAAPSQPSEYRIVEAPSTSELARLVGSMLYVQHDGTVWVPLGGALESRSGTWVQTMARYE